MIDRLGRQDLPIRTVSMVASPSLVDLADVRIPVMNVAGESGVLMPKAAAHHVPAILPNAPEVRLPSAPGGHLGVAVAGR